MEGMLADSHEPLPVEASLRRLVSQRNTAQLTLHCHVLIPHSHVSGQSRHLSLSQLILRLVQGEGQALHAQVYLRVHYIFWNTCSKFFFFIVNIILLEFVTQESFHRTMYIL